MYMAVFVLFQLVTLCYLCFRTLSWLPFTCQMLSTTGTSTLTLPLKLSGEISPLYLPWFLFYSTLKLHEVTAAPHFCMCRLYLLYHHWILKVLLYFFIVLNLSLAIFEEPAVLPLPTWVRCQCFKTQEVSNRVECISGFKTLPLSSPCFMLRLHVGWMK